MIYGKLAQFTPNLHAKLVQFTLDDGINWTKPKAAGSRDPDVSINAIR